MSEVVKVADSGTSATQRAATSSTPASAWTLATMPTLLNGSGGSWVDIAYSPSLDRFVAIGSGSDNNNNVVATSDDRGATWTGRAVPNQNTWTMNAICWSADLSLFVIVTSAGPTTSTRVLTSPDGITWTARTLPTVSISLNGVAWSSNLSLFCAVGNSNAIFTSPDGTTWTQQTGPATSKNWVAVCWAGGTIAKFCAVATGGGGSNDLMYSSNGTAWTQQTLSGSAFSWACIAYSSDLDQLQVVGGNTGVVVRSSNATAWTQISTGIGTTPYKALCWSPSLTLWVAVGTNAEMTSPDGVNWTTRTPASSAGWNGIAAVIAGAGVGGGGGGAAVNRLLPVKSNRLFPVDSSRLFPRA